jgi:hypothetical protein
MPDAGVSRKRQFRAAEFAGPGAISNAGSEP